MIILEGITELHRRTANKTIKRYELAEMLIAKFSYSDGHNIRCTKLNSALAEQEN